MNWCPTHWGYLKEVLTAKGLDPFIGHGAKDAIDGLTGERFDPLMWCWSRINAEMLKSPGLHGRVLECPLCILVNDGQPHLVESWVDKCTDEAVAHISLPLPPRPADAESKGEG